MRNQTWIAAAAGTAAVVVATTLWVEASETGHGTPDVGAGVSSPETCVGTRPGPANGPTAGPTADSTGGPSGAPEDTPLERTRARVAKLAAGRLAAEYTGLSVDEGHDSADVWRIPSARFDHEVCAVAEMGVTLRLHDTDVDRKTLDRLYGRIAADMNRWNGTFQMREVGVDERGFVLVGVDDPDRAGPVIEKAYGSGDSRYIRVEHTAQIEAVDASRPG